MFWKLSILYVGLVATIANATNPIYDVCLVCSGQRITIRSSAAQKRINSFQANPNYNMQYPPQIEQTTPMSSAALAEIAANRQNEVIAAKANSQVPTSQDPQTSTLARVPLQKNKLTGSVLPDWQNANNIPTALNAAAATVRPQPSFGLPQGQFYSNLFSTLALNIQNANILISPLSLQTLLALVNMGATGQTSQQLTAVLGLPFDKTEAAKLYNNLLRTQLSTPNSHLIMANKLYFEQTLGTVHPQFQYYANNFFLSEVEPLNFQQSDKAAGHINAWVSDQTNNRIQNIISPSSLNSNTQAILVNAIYFKAKWANEFSTMDTTKTEFFVAPQRSIQIDMMFNDDVFRYADIPQIDAKILELPYANSNMTMTFILPNKIDGLLKLEQDLSNIDWNTLWTQLKYEQVAVHIPKFKVEYDVDMTEPLKAIGIVDIFTSAAELPLILNNSNKIHISKIQHRAVIDVNEAGSEAAAASFAKFVPLSLPAQPKTFTANHPFIYMIRSPEAVHFIGQLVQ